MELTKGTWSLVALFVCSVMILSFTARETPACERKCGEGRAVVTTSRGALPRLGRPGSSVAPPRCHSISTTRPARMRAISRMRPPFGV
jgi:hypothetical protein